MGKIKIKKIDGATFLKISVSICTILGFIIGVVLGLTSIPTKTTTSLNGEIIKEELLTNFWPSYLQVIFTTIFYFIALALLMTLVVVAFNFLSKITGGITIEFEKEKKDK